MLGSAGSALAQDQAAADPASDVIVVTAQKREENLQNVPIAIQALGTKKLDQLNVASFNDYAALLPSVTFQSSQPGTTIIYMRGVASGGDGNHSGSLPLVGVYLDEQPVTTVDGAVDVHIYDVARIESLAGPQGTLYGASSEAGTIRIITNKPSTKGFEGRVDGEVNTVAHGGVGGKLEGMVNVPLRDNIAVRAVGWYQHDAGFIDNIRGTRSFLPVGSGITIDNKDLVEKNYNDQTTYGGRAALKIDLDDNWTITPSVMGQDSKSHGAFGYDPSLGDLKVQHFLPEYRHDRFIQAALTIEGKLANFDVTYAGAYFHRNVDQSSDYTDYAEAYDSLYSGSGGIAGYFYFHNAAGANISPIQKIIGRERFTKISQEVRVASPVDQPFRIVAGLFYQKQNQFIHQDYQVANLAPELSVNGIPGTLWLTQQERVDRDYAAFGEASLDIVPTVTLTAGGRAFYYDNTLVGFFGFGRDPNGPPYNAAGSSRTGVAGCYTTTGDILRDNPGGTLLPPTVAGGPCTNLANVVNGKLEPKEADGQGFTHRLNLTWKVTPDAMVYGTWSRGFRPGGINRRAEIGTYAPDYLTNFEAGFKLNLLDHTLKINGDIYLQNWKKFQFSFLGQNSFTEIHNGPDARIKGIEMDATWTPVHGLQLTFNGAYTDAKIRKNLCTYTDPTFQCTNIDESTGNQNFIAAPRGTRLPITPRFKASASARYGWDMGETKPYVQAVVLHQSSAASLLRTAITQTGTGDVVNEAALQGRLASFTTVNFALGAEWKSFSAELFVQNAFDKRAQIARFEECGSCAQRPYIVPDTPRTIGLRLGSKF